MTTDRSDHHRRGLGTGSQERDTEVYDITSADTSLTEDQGARMKRYVIQMVIRMLCFILAIFTTGWLRWVFFIGAIILPYIAVVLANNTRQVSNSDAGAEQTSTALVVPQQAQPHQHSGPHTTFTDTSATADSPTEPADSSAQTDDSSSQSDKPDETETVTGIIINPQEDDPRDQT